MRFPRFALRLFAALLAVLQAFAPGAASIVDARPAARAALERARSHVEEPGSPHALAHQDHCVLCSAATHLSAQPTAPTPPVGDAGAGVWPARAAWFAHAAYEIAGSDRSRAPPA
ncbi:MAG: hypothetical protein IPF98_15960 [Gemmatimonadetes bacterium]|nr:hypothetical protein [Gemmatimonadota bacterium]MCC6772727.1 hypothetical protein [Gemmatimonadaceae bacterium]